MDARRRWSAATSGRETRKARGRRRASSLYPYPHALRRSRPGRRYARRPRAFFFEAYVGISKKGFIFEHDVAASSILAYREFRVLCALRIFAGRSGRAWPSVQTIATTARCSVVAARIGLRGLQGKGFLVRDGKFFDLQDDRIRIAVGPTIEFGSSGEDPNSIVEDPNSIVRRSEFDRFRATRLRRTTRNIQ